MICCGKKDMKQLLRNNKIAANRIALLLCNLERGGIQRVAVNLGDMFLNKGYEVFYFVQSYDKKKSYNHNGKVIILYSHIDMSNEKKELNSYLCNAYNLRKIKKKYEIDYTISFAPEMNLLNMISGIGDKRILTIHNCTSIRDDVNSIAYKKQLMRLGNFAYKVVPVSKWCKEDLQKNYGIHASKLQVIYNPAYIKKNIITSQRQNMILCVGRLEEVKRQWHILKAFKTIEKELPDYKLCFAGEGYCEKKLRKLTEDLGLLERVDYLGFANDMPALYTRAKLLVLTSKSEAFPCVAVEAMSYGVPIVAFDIPGGLPEAMGVIRQSNRYPLEAGAGLITEYCKVDDNWEKIDINSQEQMLGESILQLLTDKELYEEKVSGAKEMSKKFDENIIEEQWIRLLEG